MRKVSLLKIAIAVVAAALMVAPVGIAQASQSFTDVPNTWYTSAIGWADSVGVMTGTSATTFEPNNPVTRADLAQVLYNLSKQGAAPQSAIPITSGYTASVFAQGGVLSDPDDLTKLDNNIFVAYQNGVHSKGAAASTGINYSTLVEYDKGGNIVASWNLTGKCDGMGSDPANNRVFCTVNEDANSSLYIITPSAAQGQQVQHLTYSPDPSASTTTGPLASGGGTDSVKVMNGNIYISASNPAPDPNGNFTHAALFQATIKGDTAVLTPALMGNATATDAFTGKPVTLNLSDPDSSTMVPTSSPQYGGDFVLDSQGDGELIFISNPGSANQSQTRLTLGTQGVDDTKWITSPQGTLYIADTGANKVYAITGTFTPGTVFGDFPDGSGVTGFVGTLDLTSGTIRPFAIGLISPAGMMFVPQNGQ